MGFILGTKAGGVGNITITELLGCRKEPFSAGYTKNKDSTYAGQKDTSKNALDR